MLMDTQPLTPPPARRRPFAEALTKPQRVVGTLFIPLYCFGLLSLVLISPMVYLVRRLFALTGSDPSLIAFALSGLVYLGVAVLFGSFFKQAFRALRGQWGKTVLWLAIGIVGMFLLGNMIMPNLVALFHPVTTSVNQNRMANLVRSYPLFMPLMIVFVGPVIEELVYRVSVFRALLGKSRLMAYAVSALLFGFQHVLQAVVIDHNYAELWNMLPYIASGLWFNYLYDRRRNILVPLGVHIANNLLGVVVILMQG